MSLKPIERKSLSDAVYDQLSDAIVSGRMAPGSALPSERELSEMLKVNRGAIREARGRLSQAGLITIQHGGGARVLDFKRTANLDLLSQLLYTGEGTVDLKVARSVMEMRAALGPDIARLCARRKTPAIEARLATLVAAMEANQGDLATLQELAIQFWDVLVQGAENIAYELAFNSLRATYDDLREILVEVLAEELRDLGSYRAIAEAVRRGDDLSATHVARGLVEKGTQAIFQVLAALEDAEPASDDSNDDDSSATELIDSTPEDVS
ncbi:MAG: FadR family transcriptional regulator [Myxococcales bacterium]|nr:FadR family transcriptional regulator [Myxococcales bacterium]MCB9705923.1 FadR family transcriptional regulator [Myxococcales bacterium]